MPLDKSVKLPQDTNFCRKWFIRYFTLFCFFHVHLIFKFWSLKSHMTPHAAHFLRGQHHPSNFFPPKPEGNSKAVGSSQELFEMVLSLCHCLCFRLCLGLFQPTQSILKLSFIHKKHILIFQNTSSSTHNFENKPVFFLKLEIFPSSCVKFFTIPQILCNPAQKLILKPSLVNHFFSPFV